MQISSNFHVNLTNFRIRSNPSILLQNHHFPGHSIKYHARLREKDNREIEGKSRVEKR